VNDPTILVACAVVIAVSAVGIVALMRPPRPCANCGHRWARYDENSRCRVRGGGGFVRGRLQPGHQTADAVRLARLQQRLLIDIAGFCMRRGNGRPTSGFRGQPRGGVGRRGRVRPRQARSYHPLAYDKRSLSKTSAYPERQPAVPKNYHPTQRALGRLSDHRGDGVSIRN
jgi:hypothetical protein